MAKVAVDKLIPGMVLEKKVEHQGRMLLPAGIEITENHIMVFKRRGVESVDVQAEVADEVLEQSAEYVRNFFQYVDNNHPALVAMYELAVLRLAGNMASGFALPAQAVVHAEDAGHLRDMFYRGEGTAMDVVVGETSVSSFPDVYFRIKEVLGSPNASAEDVARVVSADPGLSALLLKLVNSPFYGFPSKIDSVARAVALIGTEELSTLALGISTINYFKEIPPELIDMPTFWQHSISCGILCKTIAGFIPGLSKERFFIAGLLHDVGRLILFKRMPYGSVQAMLYARENSVPLVDAEGIVLGFDHTEVADLLLKEWKFPEGLARMISGHHAPMESPIPLDAAIVQAADNLTGALEIAAGYMYVLPGLEDGAWECTGLGIDHLLKAVEEYDSQIDDVLSVFLTS